MGATVKAGTHAGMRNGNKMQSAAEIKCKKKVQGSSIIVLHVGRYR